MTTRPSLGLKTAIALSLILPALLLTEIYEHATNTLANNGHWSVTKSEIAEPVWFGPLFRDKRLTLRRDRIDLGLWHAPNEIVYKQALPVEVIRFKALLVDASYLAAEFDRSSSGFWAIRLSRSKRYPSALLHVDPEGKFLSRELLGLPALGSGWNDYEIVQKGRFLSLSINGKEAYRAPFTSEPLQRFGFRNGHNSVLLKDIEVFSPDGALVARESFRNTRHYTLVLAISLLMMIALGGLISRAKRNRSDRERFFALITAHLVLTVIFGSYLAADWYRLSSLSRLSRLSPRLIRWPDLITDADASSNERHPGVYRIVFVGSSQTYGMGANTEKDRWVDVLGRRLNAGNSRVHYDCINAGRPAWSSDMLLEEYQSKWIGTAPDLTVVDLSNNDDDPGILRKSLEQMVDLNRKSGIKTLFVLEPNDPQAADNLGNTLANHRIMSELAARTHVPVVEMQEYLASPRIYDTGFLWWDWVHLTSYGQSLFADALFPRLKEAIQKPM